MRELVECFERWLADNRADANAHLLLVALARETRKIVESPDLSQREFNAADLEAAAARVAQRDPAPDFDAAKAWVTRADMIRFGEARTASIEQHFRTAGFDQALRPKRRSPGGKHRAVWYLEPYSLPPLEGISNGEEIAAIGRTERAHLSYDFAPPGSVRPAWYVRPLVGAGSFVTRSWRGLVWAGAILWLALFILFALFTALGHGYLRRPLHTSDLVGIAAMLAVAWLIWVVFLRPVVWLLDDRIIPASEIWVSWSDAAAQLELVRGPDNRQRLQFVRYTAVCPLCSGSVELRYSQGPNRRQLIGCCREAPHDHTFSFDRVLRRGEHLGLRVA